MPEPLRTGDPEHVGAYRLVGLLGEGGQGTVYHGEGADGEQVAVKLLHARFSGDAKARSRFAAELAHAGRVAPFCTARVLDADLDGDRPYIVSEFVDGPSLSELIAAGNAPHGPALERLAIATVTALAAIHEAGVVHRDFKPNNVIMGTDGARVIDFGIARALEATGTLSSAVVGTPAYMAPEQIGGARVGPAADIFAWGCTLAYAANGVTPFGQDSIPAVMHRILHEQPDLGGLTGPLRDIATNCLAKDPAQRPTARQILLRLLGGTDSATPSETLLTEGTRASATQPTAAFSHSQAPTMTAPPAQGPPRRGPGPRGTGPQGPGPYGPGAQGPGPYGPGPYAPGPQGPGPYAAPAQPSAQPTGPWQPALRSAVADARARKLGRVASRATAVASVVLGVTTFLPWAKVGVDSGLSVLVDVTGVSGIHTLWGILTLIAAVIALNLAITHEFTPRLSAAWAAIPGGIAIAAIALLLIRRQDLHSEHPQYGKLSDAEMHGMGMAFHISLAPGVFVAIAAAVAVTVAALIARRA
jgi:hypothetical protein